MKEKIKTLLNIQDDAQDAVLDILIEDVESHLLGLLKKVNKTIIEVPSELEYIVRNITIRQYNRIGSEGFKSESVEGHTINFYELKDEFDPYLTIIEDYEEDDDTSYDRGKVLFI